MERYDFECPQFVDFAKGLERQSSEDGVFDYPAARGLFTTFKYPVGLQYPTIRILSSTPSNNSLDSSCRTNPTDSDKINHRTRKVLKRLSRSVGSIQNSAKEPDFPVFGRKRSATASGGKPKKLTKPLTPNCLKRSLNCSRKQKTTEDMELEKIAELRQQTYLNLRANELAMKKMKIKQGFIEDAEERSNVKRFQNEKVLSMRKLIWDKMNPGFQKDVLKETRANLACRNKGFITVRCSGGSSKSTCIPNSQGIKNNENNQSMEFVRPAPKSRRCLFQ